jgi:ABC-type multidrug transport system ATPase subunit
MLADEPTGNLDSKSANEVMRLLISLNRKSKRTVILITHNPEYLDYADRIFFMQDGKVVKTQVNSKVKSEDEVLELSHVSDELKEAAKEVGAVNEKSDGEEAKTEKKSKKKEANAKEDSQDTVAEELADDTTPTTEVSSEEVQEDNAEGDKKK